MLLTIILICLIGVPLTMVAQTIASPSESSSGSSEFARSSGPINPFSAYLGSAYSENSDSTTQPAPPKPAKASPVGSFSFGYDYLRSDLSSKKGPSGDLMGWYAIPQVNLNKHVGLFADFTNFYGISNAPHENIHGFTGGPIFMFPVTKKLIPYVFAEAGAVRASAKQKVNWYSTLIGGAGFNYGLSKSLALQILPIEYIATRQTGSWINNFGAQVGISLNLF